MAMTTAAEEETLLVRIYPYNPAQGFEKKTFIVHGFGTTFDVKTGWYEVEKSIALQLRKFRNNPNDPTSKPVFQVCTRNEAILIDKRVRQRTAEATKPVIAVTHAAKSRRAIPPPVVIPPEPKDAPGPEADLGEDPEFEDPVILEEDEEPAQTGGDLTTADLSDGSAARPKKALVDEVDDLIDSQPLVKLPAPAIKKATAAAKKKG